ncbi:MAG: hypothetical protein ACOC43_11860 [Desulfohalobiaceae bacterium]
MHYFLASTEEFFGAIAQSVDNWELTPSSIYLLLSLSAAILASTILVHMYNKARSRQLIDLSNSFTHHAPEDISLFLQHAQQDRSKFEISFNPNMKTSSICSLLSFDQHSLTLEMPGQGQPPKGWIDKQLYVYFSIPADKDQRLYFFFPAPILDVTAEQNGTHILKIGFPRYLEQKQRRGHFRLEPATASISKIKIWCRAYDSQGFLPKDLSQLGPAQLEYPDPEAEAQQQIKLMNISASGLKLFIPRNLRKQIGLDPEQVQDLLLYLQLRDPDLDSESCFNLLCRKRNYFLDPASKDLELGLQIMLQGKDKEQQPGLTWSRVDPGEGLPELGNWVFKQHLKLFREKGLS